MPDTPNKKYEISLHKEAHTCPQCKVAMEFKEFNTRNGDELCRCPRCLNIYTVKEVVEE